MSKFVVTAESDVVDVEFGTNDIDEAIEMYEQLCAERTVIYYSVNLYDGETGELYAYQTVVADPSGFTTTRWVAR
jgi:hypothetical protein